MTTSRTSTSTSTSRTRCCRRCSGRSAARRAVVRLLGLPRSLRVLDDVVRPALADREDAQVGLAVVHELVGVAGAVRLREEVARHHPVALAADVEPAGAAE